MERRSRDRDDDDRGRGRDRDERSSRRGRDDDDNRGSRGGSGYRYERRDASETKRRAESRGGREFDRYLKDGIKTWNCESGDHTIRILPPWKGGKHYGKDLYIHYRVGPDEESYLCPKEHDQGDCPICEERARAKKEGDADYAKELTPKHRVLVYLIDRDKEREGVQAWAMPHGLDQDICKISQDKKTGEVLPIDDPENGYDVEFTKSGQGIKTKYEGVAIARRESELGDDKWLDFAVDNPLPEQLVFYDYETIAKTFGGGGSHKSRRSGGDDDNDERGDDRSSRSRSREELDDDGRSSRRSRDDDESERGNRGRSSRDEENDDRKSNRDRSSRDEPELTWESVHEMTGRELRSLISDQDLDINPKEAKDDEDLADWICDELKLEKEERSSRRESKKDDKDEEESTSAKLRNMRRNRE